VQRIKNRAQFQAVLAGTTVARQGHFVLHRLVLPVSPGKLLAPEPDQSAIAPDKSHAPNGLAGGKLLIASPLFGEPGNWLGAMVPKRWAKRAVTRNMIKRRIYSLAETATIQQGAAVPEAAYVVRLRSAFDPRLFKSATSSLLRAAVCQELGALFAQGFQRD
jgi:ribonuclease P protein component